MTDTASAIGERALELRQQFDRSFAEPVRRTVIETDDFIAVRLGAETFAIRVAEIAGLHAGLAITPCPSPLPELLGLAGLRGALIPVYGLAALLGLSAVAEPRWIVIAAGREAAFAFDGF